MFWSIFNNKANALNGQSFATLSPSPDEAIHTDPETIKSTLQNHARESGYSIAVTSSEGPRKKRRRQVVTVECSGKVGKGA